MDRKKSVLNVSVSLFSRVIMLAAALLVRRLLITHIGNAVNGLDSLYAGIIGMLGVAELGIGSAIVYSMYSPIVAGDRSRVAALYRLYRKLYRVVGAVIFGAGLAVMPFLPFLIKDYTRLDINVYGTFLLTLVSVVISYLYSAKSALAEAHKDNYLTTGILAVSRLLRFALQAAAILIWKSFPAYLVCQIIETVVIWILTDMAVRRRYGDILAADGSLDREAKTEISRNIRAMFLHKVGTLLVNYTDSLIISAFIGVVVLGKYSNYSLIAGVLAGTLGMFFTPLTSVVGHLCAAGDPAQTTRYFRHFYSLNYILGVVFFLGYCAVIDPVIRLCFGPDLELPRMVVFIVTLNQFVSFMRRTCLLFRDASGTFYNDRWKPVAEGVANLVLSLLFVRLFPQDLRAAGVIAATIITTLLICHFVEPYVVFRHVLKQQPARYCLKNYTYIACFILSELILSRLLRPLGNPVSGILVNGALSLAVSAGTLGLIAAADRSFRREVCALAAAIPVGLSRAKK